MKSVEDLEDQFKELFHESKQKEKETEIRRERLNLGSVKREECRGGNYQRNKTQRLYA